MADYRVVMRDSIANNQVNIEAGEDYDTKYCFENPLCNEYSFIIRVGPRDKTVPRDTWLLKTGCEDVFVAWSTCFLSCGAEVPVSFQRDLLHVDADTVRASAGLI